MNARPSHRYHLRAPTMTVTVHRGDDEIEVELLWTPGEREIRWGDNARPGSGSEIDVVSATIDGVSVVLTADEKAEAHQAAEGQIADEDEAGEDWREDRDPDDQRDDPADDYRGDL